MQGLIDMRMVRCKNCRFKPGFFGFINSGCGPGAYRYSNKYGKWGFCKIEDAIEKGYDLNCDKNISHDCPFYKRKWWKVWVKKIDR